jgi:hypothetical protein
MARYRYAAALAAGSVAYVLILYRFLSYTDRNRLPVGVYGTFAAVALAIGFVITLGATRGRYRTVALMLLGICIAHLFVMICVYATPAFLGAGIAQLVDHIRTRRA